MRKYDFKKVKLFPELADSPVVDCIIYEGINWYWMKTIMPVLGLKPATAPNSYGNKLIKTNPDTVLKTKRHWLCTWAGIRIIADRARNKTAAYARICKYNTDPNGAVEKSIATLGDVKQRMTINSDLGITLSLAAEKEPEAVCTLLNTWHNLLLNDKAVEAELMDCKFKDKAVLKELTGIGYFAWLEMPISDYILLCKAVGAGIFTPPTVPASTAIPAPEEEHKQEPLKVTTEDGRTIVININISK